MFKNSLGEDVNQEVPIFPLISFNPDKNVWKYAGTGFFIQPLGGFATAKHVFYDNVGNCLPTLYAVQTTAAGERHVRTLKHFVPHPKADIAIGFLGKRRLHGGQNVTPEVSISFVSSPENSTF